jgi:hypothetical protein
MLLSSQKLWVGFRDPRSGGQKKARIPDPDLQHFFQLPGGKQLKQVIWSRQKQDRVCGPRVMENISRGSTFGDFVTILTEKSTQDVTVERSRVFFTAIAITRKIYSATVYIG